MLNTDDYVQQIRFLIPRLNQTNYELALTVKRIGDETLYTYNTKFSVDRTAPRAVGIISPTHIALTASRDIYPVFDITKNALDFDVQGFEYQLVAGNDPGAPTTGWTYVEDPNTINVVINSLLGDGYHTLYARSVDRGCVRSGRPVGRATCGSFDRVLSIHRWRGRNSPPG